MSKHTEGPWKTRINEEGTQAHVTSIRQVVKTYTAAFIGQDVVSEDNHYIASCGYHSETEANARLIAAAPELLEYGEKAVHLFEQLATALIAEGLTHILDNLKDEHSGDKHGAGSTIDKLRTIVAKATE